MRRAFLALVIIPAVMFTGCLFGKKSSPKVPRAGTNAPIPVAVTVTSDALRTDGVIPVKYTCDGEGIIPPLSWRAPGGTKITTWEIRVVDPDANGFIHWVVTGIPAGTTSVTEGNVPKGGVVQTAYRGPCPPKGAEPHHYVFNVIGRNGTLTTAIGILTATYQRRP